MIGRGAAYLHELARRGALPPEASAAAALLEAAGITASPEAEAWRARAAAGEFSADAAVLADILAHPDDPAYSMARDDALRLAYASLIEVEDHARAELIELQVRKRGPARARKLLGHHGRGWSAIKDLVPDHRFFRGFVGHMTLSARDFLDRGERLYSLEPITEVALRGGVRDLVDELCASPLLGRLRALDLAGQGIGDAGVARLAASPHVDNLVGLNLENNRLSVAGLRSLAASDGLRGLRLLSFAGNIDDVGPQAGELTPLATQLEEEHVGRIPWLHGAAGSWIPGEIEAAVLDDPADSPLRQAED